MNAKRSALSAAILSVVGSAVIQGTTYAASIEPGAYDLVILTTPLLANGKVDSGTDGNWQSSFIFGGSAPNGKGATPQAMIDSGNVISTDCGPRGSGIAGDGFAGKLGITIAADGALSVQSFSKDIIPTTAGGTFTQFVPAIPGTTQMTGNVALHSGVVTLIPTGRLGAISDFQQLCDKRWNVDNTGATPTLPIADGPDLPETTYKPLTTQRAIGDERSINGAVFRSIPDINGDGINDWEGVLVTGGDVGEDWGGFNGADFFETWRSRFLSKGPFVRDDEMPGGNPSAPAPINHAVLANDLPTSGLTVTILQQGTKGVAVASSGSVDYTPNLNASGTDTYTYRATGPGGVFNTATVTVILSNPAAVRDSASIRQGAAASINVSANDFASAGIILSSYTASSPLSAEGFLVSANTNGSFTYTPAPDFVGTDTFKYRFNTTSNEATVTITVVPSPVLSSGTYSPGPIATGIGDENGFIEARDITVKDPKATGSCVGGCFDFVITGAAASTQVVLPALNREIEPGDRRYRKFNGTAWVNFETAGGDSIASAPLGAGGGCPGPADASWKPWEGTSPSSSHIGDECLRLTIGDNGSNDFDPAVGTIADPGGLAVSEPEQGPSGDLGGFEKNTSGGCSIEDGKIKLASHADWAVLGLLGFGFGTWRARRRRQSP